MPAPMTMPTMMPMASRVSSVAAGWVVFGLELSE
jgi:hypothetical protein